MINKYESEYRTISNVIQNPGKFEGEHILTPLLWDIVLDGCADDTVYSDNGDTLIDLIINVDLPHYDDLGDPYAYAVYCDDYGFVYMEIIDTRQDYDLLINEGD